ncbi:MAG TPA: VWA domain-containing protein [Alphaproteobacteria bacterium]|nr:VWA domain-containing protein [Alphaproteobacteria bacterium]
MVIPSLETVQDDEDVERIIPKLDEVESKKGKLKKETEHEKLMHTILEDDKEKISDGKLMSESISQGIGSLTPDMIFQNLIKDFKLAKKLYGETIIKELTGYSPNYVEKNIQIPEFKREIQKNISEKIQDMKDDGLLSKEGSITDKGLTLSALVLYVEELDHLTPRGFGEKKNKKKNTYGDKVDYRNFKGDRYKDISIRQTIKKSLRRGHSEIISDDFIVNDRKAEGKISIIYGIDASGSMKGNKLKIAKKAGIALAFKAISEKNKVGMIVFGSDIKEYVPPTLDFMELLRRLTEIKASMETDISKSISKATELFPKNDTKHLILLTDALPTKGQIPENETLQAVSKARNDNITISMVGINLDNKGFELAKKITELGAGKLYKVTDLDAVDRIVLEDYESFK